MTLANEGIEIAVAIDVDEGDRLDRGIAEGDGVHGAQQGVPTAAVVDVDLQEPRSIAGIIALEKIEITIAIDIAERQ